MCLRDNRIWERVQARQRAVITGTSITRLVGPSTHRVGLVFANDQSNASFVGPDPLVTNLSGILIDGGGTGIIKAFYWEDWGGALLQPWFAAALVGASTLSVTELLLDPADWEFFLDINKVESLQRRI